MAAVTMPEKRPQPLGRLFRGFMHLPRALGLQPFNVEILTIDYRYVLFGIKFCIRHGWQKI